MKIAICADTKSTLDTISSRFARCNFYAIYNVETNEYQFVDNTAKDSPSGAGSKAVKIISDLNVSVVLAPKLGPKAKEAIDAFEIKVYEYNNSVSIENAVNEYLANAFSEKTETHGNKHK